MFITKKQHNKIVNEHYLKILKLEKELAEAKDLKSILEKITIQKPDKNYTYKLIRE